MKKPIIFILLVIAIVLFISLSLIPSLGIPEVGFDEANWAVDALRIINNKVAWSEFRMFDRYFPVSMDGKHSSFESYLLVPFVYFFGADSTARIRIGPLIFGIITLIVAYYFGTVLFNAYVGIIVVSLLILNPSFINILVKTGATYGFSIPMISLSSLIFFQKYIRDRKYFNLCLGMFFLVLGYYAKGYFIWFIISLFLTSILFYRYIKVIKIKDIMMGLICFIVGIIPMFLYYDKSNTLIKYITMDYYVTSYGYDNSAIIKNIIRRMQHFNEMLVGTVNGRSCHDPLITIFFAASYAYVLYSIIKKNTVLSSKRMLFVISIFSFTFLCSAYTFTEATTGHLLMLMPYMQLIMSIAIYESYKSVRGGFAKSLVVISAGVIMMSYLRNFAISAEWLNTERRENEHCNVQALTRWLMDNNVDNVLSLSENASGSIACLSNLRIMSARDYYAKYSGHKPMTSKWSENTMLRVVAENIALEKPYFLLEWPYYEGKYLYLKSSLEKLGKEVVVVKEFYTQGNGKEVRFVVCRLK